MSERESVETVKVVEVQSEGDEEPITETLLSLNKSKETMGKTNGETKGNTEFIGVKVARDFGKQGVFVGEIIALEYDSGDDAKGDPFYVVRYTDGDQEDLDRKELSRALQLYHRTATKDGGSVVSVEECSSDEASDANETISSGSDDEESYIPSPEVIHDYV